MAKKHMNVASKVFNLDLSMVCEDLHTFQCCAMLCHIWGSSVSTSAPFPNPERNPLSTLFLTPPWHAAGAILRSLGLGAAQLQD
jgi:hypothetical protein